MIVGVLANDNPQGLLLAARLCEHARVRVSLGGKLSRLLEGGWRLLAEDAGGDVREVPTRVMRRGDQGTTKDEEEQSPLGVLWLCDWKDTSTGWFSLSDCSLILQVSKATDSKTVAMWLVEVCQNDAVIISLQSGLHNIREMRTVFGHSGGPPTSNTLSQDMPLVATHTGRKATGSVDTTDGMLSRRESASSIYSEMSGLEGLDETFDASERSASPLPPGITSLPSPTSSDSSNRGRHSLMRDSSPGPDRSRVELATVDEGAEDSGSGSSKKSQAPVDDTGANANEAENTNANANKKKPNAVLIAGVLGFGSCGVVDETAKTINCATTHHGAIVIERLTKQNALQALGRVLLLERSGWKVSYRAHEETNNWLWGDVVWRSYEAYGAALRLSEPNQSKSLYSLLSDSDVTHRRVYAGLLDEALSALKWQKVELMDPASSPFGISFRAARALLLLPKAVFPICLRICIALRFPFQARVKNDSPYCDAVTVQRYMAPFINGEVVRIGFEAEVQTPLNQEIIELLSQVLKQQGQTGAILPRHKLEIKQTQLPELYPMSAFISVLSSLVLVIGVFIKFAVFVIDVTFFW